MPQITPREITLTIEYFQGILTRTLKQVITDVQNPDHAHYKRYEISRPLLYQAYLTSDAALNGMQMLVLDHKTIATSIKEARKDLHDEWQLHDFQIVALQRPGTKPPFFEKEAA